MIALFATLLHTGASVNAEQFTVHVSTVIGIIGLAALYERGARIERPRSAQRFCYYGALVTMFFALNGWLHDLSDYYLFSAHMVQHLLLAFVVAPLLLAGTPGWMADAMLGRLVRRRGLGDALRAVTRPVPALIVSAVALIGWHLPGPYGMALEHHRLHVVEHLVLLA